MEENFESSNIHLSWLENILEQLRNIQNMERMMREGCQNLIEFVEIPREARRIIIPEAQYQNLRFITMELDILVTNLSPILKKVEIEEGQKNKLESYKENIKKVLDIIYKRELFLSEKRVNNQPTIKILPFFDSTVDILLKLKANLISDIGHLLYLEEDKKKW